MFLKLSNSGSEETDIFIQSFSKNEAIESIILYENGYDSDISCLSQMEGDLIYKQRTRIRAKSQIEHRFVFRPKSECKINIQLLVYFKQFLDSKPQIINLIGECIKVPIFIEQSSFNLDIVVYGQIYMQDLKFRKRSKKPMKYHIFQPKETKRFFEFLPSIGQVKTDQKKFQIWVKLKAELKSNSKSTKIQKKFWRF